jgi:hypothetical protein
VTRQRWARLPSLFLRLTSPRPSESPRGTRPSQWPPGESLGAFYRLPPPRSLTGHLPAYPPAAAIVACRIYPLAGSKLGTHRTLETLGSPPTYPAHPSARGDQTGSKVVSGATTQSTP